VPGHPYRDAWLGFTPMGRFGVPKELRTVALYFVSPASGFMVDGGRLSFEEVLKAIKASPKPVVMVIK